MGLPIFESSEAVDNIDQGDELEIDAVNGVIRNKTKNLTFKAQPIPQFMQVLLNEGGLLNYVINKNKGDE
jgi:3-isopropylmalate/(R)-2-methylmalate dehydratase small subunit